MVMPTTGSGGRRTPAEMHHTTTDIVGGGAAGVTSVGGGAATSGGGVEDEEDDSGENEMMLKRLGATYSSEINEIDFDNPQLYHEIFAKSSNVKHTLDKLMVTYKSGHDDEEKLLTGDELRLKGTHSSQIGSLLSELSKTI